MRIEFEIYITSQRKMKHNIIQLITLTKVNLDVKRVSIVMKMKQSTKMRTIAIFEV